jgi:hypothetical protein
MTAEFESLTNNSEVDGVRFWEDENGRRPLMRKSFLALTVLGMGAGLLYAVKGRRASGEVPEGQNESEDENAGTEVTAKAPDNSVTEESFDSETGNSSSMGRISKEGSPLVMKEAEPEIDDRGTDQSEASNLLKNIRDAAFDSSDEKLALALGRPADEIEDWINGSGIIDGDVVMKARGLATERGVHIE